MLSLGSFKTGAILLVSAGVCFDGPLFDKL